MKLIGWRINGKLKLIENHLRWSLARWISKISELISERSSSCGRSQISCLTRNTLNALSIRAQFPVFTRPALSVCTLTSSLCFSSLLKKSNFSQLCSIQPRKVDTFFSTLICAIIAPALSINARSHKPARPFTQRGSTESQPFPPFPHSYSVRPWGRAICMPARPGLMMRGAVASG